MKKNINNKKGFTLVEVLVATALLAIFVSMAILGTTSLFGTGESMMSVSKSAVLGSDIMKTIINELRFGEEFSVSEDGTTIMYNSAAYGDNCTMQVDASGQLIIVQTTSSVNTDTGETTENNKSFYPIGSAAYDEVRIKSVSFTMAPSETNKDRQVITFTVSITSDGTNVLWEQTAKTIPLYQKASTIS